MNLRKIFGFGKVSFKLIGIILFLLIISLSVFAATIVSITPNPPAGNDDLTCFVNGQSTGFTAYWKGTGVTQQNIAVNPLPSIYTIPGTITCEAWKRLPTGSYKLGAASVYILNTRPVINPLIPDRDVIENSGLNSNLINLWDNVNDAETPDAQLTYTIIGETGLNIVYCAIRNDATGAWIDCTTQPNQFGYSDVTVRISDGSLLYAEDVFRVNVLQNNQAPTLALPDPITIDEDSGLNRNIDLWAFASDLETSVDKLRYHIISETRSDIADCSVDSNRWIECKTLPDQYGNSDVTVEVSDGYANGITTDTFTLIVNPINDAPVVLQNLPDVQMWEDMPETVDPQIDLDNFVFDVDNTPAEIIWTVSSDKTEVTPVINADNTISYILAQDYFGHATITVTATDPSGDFDTEDIFVTVMPMNDAPIVDIPVTDINFDEDTTYTTLWNLNDYVSDVDNKLSEIKWTYYGNNFINVDINWGKTVTFSAPENWNGGPETIYFIATDIGDLSGSDGIAVTVNSVNDVPVLQDIHDVTFDEDTTYTITNLDSYVSDVEDTFDQLSWGYSGNVNIDVVIDKVAKTITFTPDLNWFGSEDITITVTDSDGASVSDTLRVTVNSVNDVPWIDPAILNQVQDEDAAPWPLDLTLNGHDIENPLDLKWSVSGVNTDLFTTSFDSTSNIITFSPVLNACGSDDITLTVTDPDGASASQDIIVTLNCINDIPFINPAIPDQIKNEGSAPWGLDLDKYGYDVEDAQSDLVWSVSDVDSSLLTINIDPVTHIAIFQLLNSDVNGQDTVTFTLTDTQGASVQQNVLVTINSVNDAPIVANIPDVTFDEDLSTVLDLNPYVSDVDNPDSDMTWTWSGNNNIIVSIVGGIATFSAPADWNGQEIITLQACDLEPLCSSDQIIVKVNPINDAPVVSIVPNTLTTDEDVMTSVDLDNFVSDIDNPDSDMTWTWSGNINIQVNLVADNVAVFTPAANWNGQEDITFTACDLGQDNVAGNSDDSCASGVLTVIVNSVNDIPVITPIPDVTFDEDTTYTTTWSLNDYVTDADGDIISWTASLSPNMQSITINGDGTVTFIPNLNYFGYETITFTANDGNGGTALDSIIVGVSAVNDAPVVSDIPSTTIPEDSIYNFVDLDNYVSDVDNLDSEISWTYSGNNKIKVFINPATHEVLLIPETNWNGGPETILFTACDPGQDKIAGNVDDSCASDSAAITVSSAGDTPVVSDIPDITNANEDIPYTTSWSLNDYVADPDTLDADISWSWTGDTDINIILNPDRTITITSKVPNWYGVNFVTFTACDETLLCDSDQSMIVVNSVNDAPVISSIPDQIKFEDDPAWPLDLTSYATDVEDLSTDLVWSVSGVDTTLYTTSFDASQRVITFTPVANACSNTGDLITLTVTDTEGLTDTQDISVILTCVNDPIVLADIPNVELDEGSSPVTLLNLNNFVSDIETPDNLITWAVSPTLTPIVIAVDPVTHDVTFSISNPEYSGAETFTFTACDNNLPQSCASDNVIVTVNNINDAPVITSFNPVTPFSMNEGSSQAFSITDSDIDGGSAYPTYSWTLDGTPITGAVFNTYTFNAVDGTSTQTLTAIISDGSLTDSQSWTININNVAPQGVSADGPYYCAVGSTVMLSGSATDPGINDVLTYSWDFDNDGVYDDSTTQNPYFPCASAGIFNVGLRVSDGIASVDASTTVTAYDIVINEIMKDPSAVLDTAGEWFELYNDGAYDVNLNGWIIKDDGTDSHTITSLTIPAGEYVVLCRNSDPTLNGGVTCDYQYSSFILGNDDDEIVLVYNGIEMDRVNYDNGITFPDPVGSSMELKNPNLDNNIGSNWQVAIMPYGLGDLGTPGLSNGNMCGDGIIQNPPEECDGINLDLHTCQTLGFDFGSLTCSASCTFDTSSCGNYVCGNNIREGSEMCDGTDLSGASCISLGFTGGILACQSTCLGFDTSGCTGPIVNQPPIANAGPDQSVLTGSPVTLNGAGSSDVDGTIVSYSWTQTAGPVVTLSDTTIVNPTFTPTVSGTYTFALTVTDDDGAPSVIPDTVNIFVSDLPPLNQPPVINSISLDPNPVAVNGLLTCTATATDPNLDPVTITYSWATTGAYSLAPGISGNILNLNLVSGETAGDIITCTATPNDGFVDGTSGSDSSTVGVAATLSGNVYDSSGINNNIYNALVEIKQGSTTITSDYTDDLANVGYYSLSSLLDGTYTLIVTKPGFTSYNNMITLLAGANTQNINLVPNAAVAGVVSGSVKNIVTGITIADAQVIIRNAITNEIIQVVETDASGNYLFTGVPSGMPYNLEAQKAGYSFVFGPTNIGIIAGSMISNQNIFMV